MAFVVDVLCCSSPCRFKHLTPLPQDNIWRRGIMQTHLTVYWKRLHTGNSANRESLRISISCATNSGNSSDMAQEADKAFSASVPVHSQFCRGILVHWICSEENQQIQQQRVHVHVFLQLGRSMSNRDWNVNQFWLCRFLARRTVTFTGCVGHQELLASHLASGR